MKRSFSIILAGIVLAGAILACKTGTNSHVITYEVTGSVSSAAVTMRNSSGDTEHRNYELPVRQIFTLKDGDAAYVSAQIRSGSGNLTCSIYVDGKLWKTSTVDGDSPTVTCSGVIGE